MLSRTVVHHRMPKPGCRNLQEHEPHGTVVKRGGTRSKEWRQNTISGTKPHHLVRGPTDPCIVILHLTALHSENTLSVG